MGCHYIAIAIATGMNIRYDLGGMGVHMLSAVPIYIYIYILLYESAFARFLKMKLADIQ